MLDFLVTSKARRRLLVLLWGERKGGSVSDLAKLADVSFGRAHAELKEMQRLQLVRSDRDQTPEQFSANPDHPQADLLMKLAEAEVQVRSLSSVGDEELRRKLVSLGAPLRGVRASSVEDSEVLEVLMEGADLARRDAVVARSLPLCFWTQRERLDGKAFEELRGSPETKHAFAFFVELAGILGGDRRLVGVAEVLRDQRLTQLRPFFGAMKPGSGRDFRLAAKWGFTMNMELDSFRTLFEKFVTK